MANYNNMPTRNLVGTDKNQIVPRSRVPRSRFIASKTRITAFNASDIVPFHVDELLPGDHVRYQFHPFARLNTPLFPLFSNMRLDTHVFVCPIRLLWNNWERFMGAQDNPTDSINYTVPVVDSPTSGFAVGSLQDHLGIPTVGQVQAGQITRINNLFGRFYNKMYNQWWRNENLIDSAVVDLGDGPDTAANYVLRNRAKSHDYFTDALPAPQKFTAPSVPLAGLAPIQGLGIAANAALTAGPTDVRETDGDLISYANMWNGANTNIKMLGIDNAGTRVPQVYADLTGATGVNINTLRQAWLIQELLESNARAGTRYTEIVLEQFGIHSPDERLQRVEYIGGGQSPINISPIAQTSPTAGLTVGALGAAGVAAGRHTASYAATEHCLVMAVISVKADLAYQQGIHKMHNRQTRYEFYTPLLAGLGEQAVTRNEIWHRGTSANDAVVFGYVPRWDEYRVLYSDVTGRMRSTAATTIDPWHTAENFGAAPTLSPAFNNDPLYNILDRNLAAGSTARTQGLQFLAEILIERDIVRPIPIFGVPATLGRM